MLRCLTVMLIAVGFIVFSRPAEASSDFSCGPGYTLVQHDYNGCNNLAILGPGNDTRANLLLLMHDSYPQSASRYAKRGTALFEWRTIRSNFFPDPEFEESSYPYRVNSRCGSNDEGKAAFEKALNSAQGVSAEERAALNNVRSNFSPECPDSGMREVSTLWKLEGINSPAAKEFATYLRAAMGFYEGDFDAAATDFASLSNAKNSWVRETAAYMAARNELNRAQQTAFDEYGSFSGAKAVDQSIVGRAESGFAAYLKAYPQGIYAASARGLLRRVYWLSGDMAKLAASYRTQLGSSGALTQADLAEEIDLKLLPLFGNGVEAGDPIMLAVMDLMRMRENGGYEEKPITRAELEAQRSIFAKQPELYEYLLAAHSFYIANKPADVLKLIPDAARQSRMSYLQFSRQALRGLALEAVKDPKARGFWQQLLGGTALPYQRPAAELGLAMNMERGNALDAVFAPGSAVEDSDIRQILLQNVAGPDLLRKAAVDKSRPTHEREVALFTLLYKGLSQGQYAGFVGDVNLTPAGAATEGWFYDLREAEKLPVGMFKAGGKKSEFACPHVKDSAAILAKTPGDVRARLCVADFLRLNGFDNSVFDAVPEADELGGTKSRFSGTPMSRLEVYKSVIANTKAAATDRAYALYRAVWCYGPSGINSCGGKGVDIAQRKAWFNQLKREYPASEWAKKLRYYW